MAPPTSTMTTTDTQTDKHIFVAYCDNAAKYCQVHFGNAEMLKEILDSGLPVFAAKVTRQGEPNHYRSEKKIGDNIWDVNNDALKLSARFSDNQDI